MIALRPARPRALVVVFVLLATLLVTGPSRADQSPVEAWGTDPNSLSGTIDEVCGPGPGHDAAADRAGRVALVAWLDQAFPDIQGFGGFDCREIHNPRGSCQGRDEPASSTCWSTHAAGRAIDVMTGGTANQDGPPVGKALGDAIVNTLLAPVDGIDNHLARTMGIQQLLWNGRCWSASEHGDDGITDINQLDGDCVDLHDNHVHITLSEAGADGRTSFHIGGPVAPPMDPAPQMDPAPRMDVHVLLYDVERGNLVVRDVGDDGRIADRSVRGRLGVGWTSLATPDVAGNGDSEVLAYRQDTGEWTLRELGADGALGRSLADRSTVAPGYTLVMAPDVDGDGDDEVLFYRSSDGRWALHELGDGGALGPALEESNATTGVAFTSGAAVDIDGDGDDEVVLYRRFDGAHLVVDFGAGDEVPVDADRDGVVDAGARLHVVEPSGSTASGPAPAPRTHDVGLRPGEFDATEALAVLDRAAADARAGATSDPRDGEVDVAAALAVLDRAAEQARASASLPTAAAEGEVAEPVRVGGLGIALPAGFTALTRTDVDGDGGDELVVYDQDTGCLAIRRLAAAGSRPPATENVVDLVPACVLPPADVHDGEVEPEVDPTTWLVESWDGPGAGWTSVVTAQLG